MVVLQLSVRLWGLENLIQREENHLELDIIVITQVQKLKHVTGHVESGNMKLFKLYFEETEIESLEALIANPDPSRVKMYGGGTRYVDMLKKKLERVQMILTLL